MIFVGTYDHTIDDKGRVAIPADIRSELASELPGGEPVRMYVTFADSDSLALYTEAEWKKQSEALERRELTDELNEYLKVRYSLAGRAELDKAGRIRLPDHLMKMVGLEPKSNVALIGVRDRLEVRDRQKWQEHLAAKLAANPQLMMNPALAMRKLSPIGQGRPAND